MKISNELKEAIKKLHNEILNLMKEYFEIINKGLHEVVGGQTIKLNSEKELEFDVFDHTLRLYRLYASNTLIIEYSYDENAFYSEVESIKIPFLDDFEHNFETRRYSDTLEKLRKLVEIKKELELRKEDVKKSVDKENERKEKEHLDSEKIALKILEEI